MTLTEDEQPPRIRSFVRRMGRITGAQERALEELWPRYGLDLRPGADPPDLDRLYGRRAARVVEIGFGNGENLLSLAAANPARDYLGIEVHRPGVGRLLLEAERAGLTNLRVACHDAVEVFGRVLPPRSLAAVLVLFPDPWHKKRHNKRRLVQAPFVALLADRLVAGGLLHAATDWEPYALQMLAVLGASPLLENLAGPSGFVPRPDWRPPTRFEKRGRRLGHGVWDLAFERRA